LQNQVNGVSIAVTEEGLRFYVDYGHIGKKEVDEKEYYRVIFYIEQQRKDRIS
jgi:hypothetical protein